MLKNTFTVNFLETCEIITAHCVDEHPMDKLEEVLYIWQEVTPTASRCSWTYALLRGEPVRFTYHNYENVWVWLVGSDKVYVADSLALYWAMHK